MYILTLKMSEDPGFFRRGEPHQSLTLGENLLLPPQTKLREGNVFTGVCGEGSAFLQCRGLRLHFRHADVLSVKT